eukprot:465509-Rhodomonas_salina.1
MQAYDSTEAKPQCWQLQQHLASVDAAHLQLGVSLLGMSPTVTHGWGQLDPDLWTADQWSTFQDTTSGTVFLSGSLKGVELFLKVLRDSSRRHKWMIVGSNQYHPTPSQVRTNSLL